MNNIATGDFDLLYSVFLTFNLFKTTIDNCASDFTTVMSLDVIICSLLHLFDTKGECANDTKIILHPLR